MPPRLRPHSHRTAAPKPRTRQTSGPHASENLERASGNDDTDTQAHTSRIHPSASFCGHPSPAFALGTAPAHRLRSFSALHPFARYPIRRPAASLPVRVGVQCSRTRRPTPSGPPSAATSLTCARRGSGCPARALSNSNILQYF